jgi:hypothetical protein
MKSFFLIPFFIIQLYGMEKELWHSTQKVKDFLQEDISLKTEVYFNIESAKEKNNRKKLSIKIKFDQKVIFFSYGNNLQQLIKRFLNKKNEIILDELEKQNKINHIALETKDEWNKRKNKNKNKMHFIEIETINELHNIYNYKVFFNALNNAITLDNPEIKNPFFTCNIKINNKEYLEEYNNLSDNLKKIITIDENNIQNITKLFAENNNQEYYAYKEEQKIKKNKTDEERKNKAWETKNAIGTMNQNKVIEIIEDGIKMYEEKINTFFEKKTNKIVGFIEENIKNTILKNKIKIGENTKTFLKETYKKYNRHIIDDDQKKNITIKYTEEGDPDIIAFLNCLIEHIMLDSNLKQYFKKDLYIEKKHHYSFIFLTSKTKNQNIQSLMSDESYSNDDFIILEKLKKFTDTEKEILVNKIRENTTF